MTDGNPVIDERAGMVCGADLNDVGVHWLPTGNPNHAWVITAGGTRRIRLSRRELEDLHRILETLEAK
ncbi:hypothetical protein [Bifidobacterium callitrichidarum]|uniref:Uncharacterized protein n=1 Tax=Bifidobacterium callitrichidarum TaxID=2052941 RepID=A0A2U2N8W4_9BIFI|nr:hypothetical protein [Bifidobacterium callitrichidarum]PWG65615.1 hypothetical protein DF196_06690 [Bifidobacterium callitrichidarum]